MCKMAFLKGVAERSNRERQRERRETERGGVKERERRERREREREGELRRERRERDRERVSKGEREERENLRNLPSSIVPTYVSSTLSLTLLSVTQYKKSNILYSRISH